MKTKEQQVKKMGYNNYVCECGCGEIVPYGSRFISGHNLMVQIHPTEIPECLKRMKEATKGIPRPWLKGENNPAKNLKVRKKISKASIGKKKSEKHKNNLRISANKQWQDPEQIKLRKEITTKQWQNSEYVSQQMIARYVSPNKTEQLLDKILNKLFPNQFKFVGDGKDKDYILGGKCPDFVHTSKKLLIELFGDYWHGEERNGIPEEQHMNERIEHFAKYGYQTLIIWEHELKKIKYLFKKMKNPFI